LALIINSIWQNVKKVMQTTDPSVLCGNEFNIHELTYSMKDSKILPIMTLIDKRTGSVHPAKDATRFMTLRGEHWNSYYSYDQHRVIENIMKLDVVPCSELVNHEPYKWYFEDTTFELVRGDFFCVEVPRESNLEVQGDRFTKSITTVRMHAYPCSFTDSTKCADNVELDELSLLLIYRRQYIKYDDFDNPVHFTNHIKEEVNLTTDLKSIFYMNLQKISLEDHTNWVQK